MGKARIVVYDQVFGLRIVFETTLFILNGIEQIHNGENDTISQDHCWFEEHLGEDWWWEQDTSSPSIKTW